MKVDTITDKPNRLKPRLIAKITESVRTNRISNIVYDPEQLTIKCFNSQTNKKQIY